MKKVFTFVLIFCIMLICVACSNDTANNGFIDDNQSQNDDMSEIEGGNKVSEMYIYIDETKLTVELEQNVAVNALVELLKQGDISYTANDYGSFEKVGYLGYSLPTDNSQITTTAGDVVLYSGNQIVIFYGSNTWSYTKLGKIKSCSDSELSNVLGGTKKTVQVRLSLK